MKDRWEQIENIAVIFEATSKFLIVFVRLVLGRMKVDGFTGHGEKLTSDMNQVLRQF